MCKGKYYKYINPYGQTVIVICTEEPTTASCFTGVVVACDLGAPKGVQSAGWYIGYFSEDWIQEGFKPFDFKP